MEQLPIERRRRPRISTMILCEISRDRQAPELVRVRDMSECGLKIAAQCSLAEGTRLKIRMPGVERWVPAQVVWSNGKIAGIAFSQAIDLPQAGTLPPRQL